MPDERSTEVLEADLPSTRGQGRVIAVGGGRGGVGKSLVAVNVAVYLAQLGKSVLLVDADLTGSNLHTHFGLHATSSEAPFDEPPAVLKDTFVPTNVPGLELLAAPHDSIRSPMAYRPGGKSRWLQRLKGLGIEFIVVDVGPGHGVFSLDVMLAADIPIAVTLPEPPAIETTYRFLRAVYRRRLRRSLGRDRFRLGLLDRAVLDMGMLPSPMDLVRVLVKVERALAEIAWQEAQRMRFQLVVNEARVRTDMEFGSWMSTAVNRHYGIRLDELGHIEHDDAVWLAVRRGKPLLVESPTSKAGRNLERIARRVLALTATRLDPRGPSSPFPTTEPTLYAVLGLARTSTDEEVRRAHKRQREIYAPGSLVTASLLNEAEHKAALLRLGEAFETLLDPVRRRAYDLSMFPDEPTPVMVAEPTRPGLAAEQLMLQRELQREIGPDTEFTGALLRKVRESLGVELADVTLRTKIARLHLQAMEDETYELLPPMVYVRGFVAELAKYLKLDALQVQKTYMRRMRENHPVQTKGEG